MMTQEIDLLCGLGAIGRHLQLAARQVRYLHLARQLTAFKMCRSVCATRGGLADQFRKLQEGAHGERI